MRRFIIILSVFAVGAANVWSRTPEAVSDSIQGIADAAITGIVVDTSGEPVIGAPVSIKEDAKKSVVTDNQCRKCPCRSRASV